MKNIFFGVLLAAALCAGTAKAGTVGFLPIEPVIVVAPVVPVVVAPTVPVTVAPVTVTPTVPVVVGVTPTVPVVVAPSIPVVVAPTVPVAPVVNLGAISYATSGYSQSYIGQDPGFGGAYDQFTIAGVPKQNITVLGTNIPTLATIGQYDFVTGPNCASCWLTPGYNAMFGIKIGNTTQNFNLPFVWSSTGGSDVLTFGAVAPLLFNIGDLLLSVTAITPGVLSTNATISGNLQASFAFLPKLPSGSAVPEPGTAAMLLTGLGLAGFVARRRQGKKAA